MKFKVTHKAENCSGEICEIMFYPLKVDIFLFLTSSANASHLSPACQTAGAFAPFVFAAIALTFVEFRVLGFSLERKDEE